MQPQPLQIIRVLIYSFYFTLGFIALSILAFDSNTMLADSVREGIAVSFKYAWKFFDLWFSYLLVIKPYVLPFIEPLWKIPFDTESSYPTSFLYTFLEVGPFIIRLMTSNKISGFMNRLVVVILLCVYFQFFVIYGITFQGAVIVSIFGTDTKKKECNFGSKMMLTTACADNSIFIVYWVYIITCLTEIWFAYWKKPQSETNDNLNSDDTLSNNETPSLENINFSNDTQPVTYYTSIPLPDDMYVPMSTNESVYYENDTYIPLDTYQKN